MARPIHDNSGIAPRQHKPPRPSKPVKPPIAMTKSQRRVVADDPYRRPSNPRFKWGRVTEGSLDPQVGYLHKTTFTASTGRIVHKSIHDRRGKVLV